MARLGALREPTGLGLTEEERDAEAAVLDGWLARARALAERFVTARGQTVGQVIERAGGLEAFAEGVKASLLLGGRWWQADTSYGALRQLESDLAGTDRELGLLGEHQYFPTGSLGEALINRQTEMRTAIAELKAAIDARRGKEVSALVGKAAGGDADATALLAEIVRGRQDAFAKGTLGVLLSAATDAGVAREAAILADEQEQRRQRIAIEDRAVALLKAVGPNGVQAMRRSLRTALLGNRRDAEFELVRIIKVGSNAHGFAGDVPALSPIEQRRLGRLILELADVHQ
jgi:hypothetical protein